MTTKEELLFRQVVTLRDGARVLIRPLVTEDRQMLLDLLVPVSPDELRFMRHNVVDPAVVNSWIDNLNYDRVFPMVAVIGDRIVGEATLHFGKGYARHRAELRIFLAKDFRRRGLGMKLTQAMIDIAKRRSLYMLEVQIVRDLSNDIKAMEKVGFEVVVTYEDYYMLPNGELRDVVHMLLRLRTPEGEF
ncbi:MAG: GNAT family N-acetyltransferase [Chloroflexi bacterium]|nr:GNAT family N-acetyltransferase [Chloroflexota bacterium]